MTEEGDENFMQCHLCTGCIGEAFLKSEIESVAEWGKCHYCKSDGLIISISKIASYIDTAFKQHFQLTPSEPSWLESKMIWDGDLDWERKGEPAVCAISLAAKIDEKPADDIRKILELRDCDVEAGHMGEESPFAEKTHYLEKEPDDVEYLENWRYFENSLKTQTRFFDRAAEAILDDIFEELDTHCSPDGKPVVLLAGPETKISSLYRARVFESEANLKEALKRPDLHIGPPPANSARPGRMNAYGISVFYGATSPTTAINEVRPPVDSRVIVGEFELLHRIRLLDISALRSACIQGSIFDPSYIKRLERAKFLQRLSERISRPVMPSDELLEYLITQAIADYLATRSNPILDGILYPSVQDGINGANVMLFHKASRAALADIPKDTRIDASLGHQADEELETDYHVWEEVPVPKMERTSVPYGFSSICESMIEEDRDSRDPMLRLKIEGLQVHHINALSYDTKPYSVSRHRSTEQQPEF